MTTITAVTSGNTTTPLAVDGYEAERESRNIIHDLLSGNVAVTLISPRPRAGTLQLMYTAHSDAFAAFNLHAEETVFTITNPDVTNVGMSYVVRDGIGIRQDDTRAGWIVSVDFQEVTA
ncbi:hypothetical protein [Microbacterium sp. T2.11-28]|uniref:hypothetical protein n=1 Tax=Microbacterium sp. T2.11-28 TaxID=3041169 RepID=UPI00247782DB|nr:hypothetical protein [Microbacterium sp. T2.11-28]CAI9386090.1 hypothetical protein MICABA_00170 [Microbacterium sp. T2.11-28]